MSTHLDFDDSPRLPPHDQSYDLGIPLGAKTGFPYISSSHLDAFMGGEYVGQSTFHVPPPISFSEYPQDGGCFYREPYVPSTHITLLDARPHIQEPSPHRVNSPRLLFPPPTIWPDAEHRSQVMLDNTEQTRASYYQNIAPLQQPPAVTYTQTSWPVAEAQPPTHTQPQPSWTMSGSLDPATGVFQRAPEHPRVRTAQACEKCRVRKAKVSTHVIVPMSATWLRHTIIQCSGEHPTCQRCRNRGLECKYAPERKMRGPNKNKKKGMSSAEVASGRRPSVFSSGSSSDERASNPKRSSPIPPSPFRTTPRQDIPSDKDSPTGNEAIKSVVHTNITFQLPSPPRLSGYASDNSPRLRKARPPPLDLSRTNVSDQSHTSVQGEPPAQPISPEVDSRAEGASGPGRRASLPSYLMESYSRIALATSSSSDSNSDPTTSQSMDSSDATETYVHHFVLYSCYQFAILQPIPAFELPLRKFPPLSLFGPSFQWL